VLSINESNKCSALCLDCYIGVSWRRDYDTAIYCLAPCLGHKPNFASRIFLKYFVCFFCWRWHCHIHVERGQTELSKSFAILRALVFILLQTVVLAFVTIVRGDLFTSLIVSAGVFFLSIVGAFVLMLVFRRGKKQ
jgi:hypothetical protein